jgi:hypothetical protein
LLVQKRVLDVHSKASIADIANELHRSLNIHTGPIFAVADIQSSSTTRILALLGSVGRGAVPSMEQAQAL